ncbi:MAG TPA: DUF4328 domain-containing protein [Caulobacterales bacterium]|nr:DUF4328 domain-containing protein [Caulobacterales bacterium]
MSAAEPATADAKPSIRDPSGLLLWLRIFAGAAILAYLAEGVAKGLTWALYARYLALARADAERIDQLATYAGYALMAAFWLSAFMTLRLTYRLTKNLHTVGGDSDIPSPGWAVGCYFVPLVNLVMPALLVNRIWRRTHQLSGEGEKPSAIIGWWWGLWIVTAICSWIATVMTGSSHQPDANVSRETHTIALALFTTYLLGRALCAVLLLTIFGQLVRAQRAIRDFSMFD